MFVLAPALSCLIVVYVILYVLFKPLLLYLGKKNENRVSFEDWCDLDRLKKVYFQHAINMEWDTFEKKNHVKFDYVTFSDSLKLHTMTWQRPNSANKTNKKVLVLLHGSASSSVTSFGRLIHRIALHSSDVDEIHCIDMPGFAFSSFPAEFKRKVSGAPGRKRRRCCLCCWCCCCRPTFSSDDVRAIDLVRTALSKSLLRYVRTKIRGAKEIILLGHSIGSHIAVETARLDAQSSKKNKSKACISKVVLMSPAGVLPAIGGSSSLAALAFHLGIPVRQGKCLLRTTFGKRFMYTFFESIGMSSRDMISWRVRFEPSAWLADLPSWSVTIRYSTARWIDPSLKTLLEAARTIKFSMLSGEFDPLCRISYVEKVAECLWPQSCSREVFNVGNMVSRKFPVGSQVDVNSMTSSSRKDSSVAPLVIMKDCGHSVMDAPFPQFFRALDMSIRNARVQDAVSIRFARLLKDVPLNDDAHFRSPFDLKGSDAIQSILHRRLSDRLDQATQSLDMSAAVGDLIELPELDEEDEESSKVEAVDCVVEVVEE